MLPLPSLVLVVVTVLFVAAILQSVFRRRRNLPPGPRGYPIIGNLPLLKTLQRSDVQFNEFFSKYGKVVSLNLGRCPGFVLNGYDVMREALVEKAELFSDRPSFFRTTHRTTGLIFNPHWKERRRFALVSMRDMGLGKRSLDEVMLEEAQCMVTELESRDGAPVDMRTLLSYVTSNVICSIILGKRFEYDDKEFLKLLDLLTAHTRGLDRAGLQRFIPWLKYFKLTKQVQSTHFIEMTKTITKWKMEHDETFDEDNIRDLIDVFIAASRKEGSAFDEEDLVTTVTELFSAGTDTTSTTMCWAILYLLHHPDIKTRCREELTQVVGDSRLPEYADLKNTPYTHAFLNEVQRVANIVPMAIWHGCSADTELAGYTIPAGSAIIMNMRSALRDPEHFTDPDTFNPDRWLDEDGKVTKNSAFIPFSLGKRVCLGEQLARKEYFIFMSTLLLKFDFPEYEGSHDPEDCKCGPIKSPNLDKISLTKL